MIAVNDLDFQFPQSDFARLVPENLAYRAV
jgi:hypothetical protein